MTELEILPPNDDRLRAVNFQLRHSLEARG